MEEPPKSLAGLRLHRRGWPIFEEIVFPVPLCFLAQEIEPAGGRITIQLLFPALCLNIVDALGHLTEFLRAQLRNRAFNFVDRLMPLILPALDL
jgi:hypothetical protein